MDVVGKCFGTGRLYGFQTIAEHGCQDIDHLPVAAGLAFQLAPDTTQCCWQLPALERCAIAQSARFAGQNRDVVQGIVDGLATPEGPCVRANDPALLPALKPVCIGPDLDRPAYCAGIDRVTVIVEPHQTGLGH